MLEPPLWVQCGSPEPLGRSSIFATVEAVHRVPLLVRLPVAFNAAAMVWRLALCNVIWRIVAAAVPTSEAGSG